MSAAISSTGLRKTYGKKVAVEGLDLAIEEGSAYVFLGRNGAGKTTTIKMLMGQLQPTEGTMEVLGMDPDKDAVKIRQQVGYMVESQKMYDWMTIAELINFTKSFYETWDDDLTASLLKRFELNKKTKLKDLSRGMYGKAALLITLASRPKLLVLDDPTLGLDTIARHDLMEGIIEVLHEQQHTVFFSTHIIPEVERIADSVGILEDGKLLYSGPLDDLKQSVRKVDLRFDGEVPENISAPGMVRSSSLGHTASLIIKDYTDSVLDELQQFKPQAIDPTYLSLEEIFIALVKKPETAEV